VVEQTPTLDAGLAIQEFLKKQRKRQASRVSVYNGYNKRFRQRRLPNRVIAKGLAEYLPTNVQKSHFMLSECGAR
jgi:hypothetical protein